jgi:hypothetical protein
MAFRKIVGRMRCRKTEASNPDPPAKLRLIVLYREGPGDLLTAELRLDRKRVQNAFDPDWEYELTLRRVRKTKTKGKLE